LASRNRIPWNSRGRKLDKIAEWGEVTVTTADTFTISSMSTATGAIYEAVLLQMSDGTAVACTHAEASPNGNRVTAGGAVTDVKCIYLVIGVKA